MINFIYGSNGTGKTTLMLNMLLDETKKGNRCFLIVPDQEALQFERITLSSFPASSQLNLEILGFSRLYNRVCREFGGLSYSYITKPMRSLLMWKTIHDLDGLLEGFKGIASDLSMSDMMVDTINELKSNGITSAMLEAAANKTKNDAALSSKLRDISLIYSCFDNLVSQKYSDSADDLARLRDTLKENVFFEGASIYIDSFYSFTAVQHQIIEEIFKQAKNVTITIPLSSDKDNSISADGVKTSLKYLKRASEKFCDINEIFLTENKRASAPSLAYLANNIWALGASPQASPDPDGAIVTEICDTPYAEAEAVSAHIRTLLQSGARCRDIAIIARDAEKYRGILDVSLSKSDIPFFFSQKTDICSFPPIKLILSALKIKKYNWQKQDVISYIKTGICDIDAREANLFEEYVSTWNISGNRFLVEHWSMNPDGFTQIFSERGEKILNAANKVREQIVLPLKNLFVKLDAAEDISSMCKVLYEYVVEIGLEDKLLDLSQKAADRNDIKQAKELSRIYQVILDTLADVAVALEGEVADTDEFAQILKNVFSKTEISSIPTSIDEVTIGSASMLRTSNPKFVFVIGLCEGEFPASANDNGLFTDKDRTALTEIGIEFLDTADTRASNELMFVQRAFSAPSKKLYAFTHKRDVNGTPHFPSLAFTRIEKLFPILKPHVYSPCDLDYLIPAPKNAVSLIKGLKDEDKKESLKKALEEHIPHLTEFSTRPACVTKCTVSPQTVAMAKGDQLYFSPTSFEKYVKCPFKYFCSSILELREKKTSDFNNANIGEFVHHVLEVLIKKAIPNDANESIMSDDEIKSLTDKTVDEYIKKICPEEMLDSKRLKHLYKRLKAHSLLLIENTIKEFSQSQFRPIFFEFSANGKDGNPSPLIFSLNDGTNVAFTGVIDRVDIYKKNGDVYIRVVDYKTGTKTFSLDDVKHGINTQMLIYLFTLCRTQSKHFKTAVGISPDKNPLPAGVIYLSSNIPVIEAAEYESSDTITSIAQSKLVRSGILLNDDEILQAMNSELDPQFLPGMKSLKKPIGFLADTEGFENIYNSLNKTVAKIGSDLKQGIADARPISYGDSPCEYCPSKLVCKNAQNDIRR